MSSNPHGIKTHCLNSQEQNLCGWVTAATLLRIAMVACEEKSVGFNIVENTAL